MIIDIDKKCKTRWRAICGTAFVKGDVSAMNGGWKKRWTRIIGLAESMGVCMCGDLNRFGDSPMHIQTRDTTPLDKVFARIKDEYGVEIDFTETSRDFNEMPGPPLRVIDDSEPPWSFRSTVPEEEKPSVYEQLRSYEDDAPVTIYCLRGVSGKTYDPSVVKGFGY